MEKFVLEISLVTSLQITSGLHGAQNNAQQQIWSFSSSVLRTTQRERKNELVAVKKSQNLKWNL